MKTVRADAPTGLKITLPLTVADQRDVVELTAHHQRMTGEELSKADVLRWGLRAAVREMNAERAAGNDEC
jgi:hypothetical protein